MATTTEVVTFTTIDTVTRVTTQVVLVSETHTVTSLFASTTETVFVTLPPSVGTPSASQMFWAPTDLKPKPASMHNDQSRLLLGVVATLAVADVILLAVAFLLYFVLRHWRSKDVWRNPRLSPESAIRSDRAIDAYNPRDEEPENPFRNPGEYETRRFTRLRRSDALASMSARPLSTGTAAASIYSQTSLGQSPIEGMPNAVTDTRSGGTAFPELEGRTPSSSTLPPAYDNLSTTANTTGLATMPTGTSSSTSRFPK
ncbi:hypothetical protein C8Q78DRAFT_648860 [Trametes maxima]|nr:hypothetical protein C8Q78DRAFT_648860 [Trametes maxima]